MDAVTLRRTIHQNPELSFHEEQTAHTISKALAEHNIEHSGVAGSGVIAKIEGEGDLTRAVILRADIDALPICELNDLEYKSHNEGVMHACGHDMHAAMLFDALCYLNENRDFEGTIFGVFQPGEELLPGGASLVLAENPFEGYTIIGAVAQHVEPDFEVGTVGFKSGKYMAASDEIRFWATGQGGHAAMRSRIKDSVGCTCELVGELLALNNVDTVLSIGKIEAAGATNVIPKQVSSEGTLRTFDEEIRRNTKLKIKEIAKQVGDTWGVDIEVKISDGYPCVVNDERVAKVAKEIALRELNVVDLELRPTAEDFGYFTQAFPSLLYRVGVGVEAGRLHTSTFNPDERAITVGAKLMREIAVELLKLAYYEKRGEEEL